MVWFVRHLSNTHHVSFTLLSYLWHTDPVHPINAVVQGRPSDSGANLQHKLNQHLLSSSLSCWLLALTFGHFLSEAIFLQMILLFFVDIDAQHLIKAHLIAMVVFSLFSVGRSLFKVTLCHGSIMIACPTRPWKPSSTIMIPVGLWIFIRCSLTTESLRLLNTAPGASHTPILLSLAMIQVHLT
jgi:hypothetical protein